MKLAKILQPLPLLILTCGSGLAIGLLVPSFFEWTEDGDWPRSERFSQQLAIIVLIVSILSSVTVWLIRKSHETQHEPDPAKLIRPVQFGLREIFAVMTLVAIMISVERSSDWPIASLVIILSALGMLGWSCFCGWILGARIISVLAVTFLPFAWIIPVSEPFGHTSGILQTIWIGAGIFPALLMSRGHFDDSVWLAASFEIVQLLAGMCLAWRGGKLMIAYIYLCLIWSSFNSVLLHALYRM